MSGRSTYLLVVDGSSRDLPALLGVAGVLARRIGSSVRRVPLDRVPREDSLDAVVDLARRPEVLISILPTSAAGGGQAPNVLGYARHVAKPVLFVPPGSAPWTGPERVLVPFDGRLERAAAAEAALRSMGVPGTALALVEVIDARRVPRYWDDPHYEYEARATELRARFGSAVGRTMLVRGDAVAERLGAMLGTGDYDMVVVVWSQNIEPGRARVTRAILASSPVPLLLVPSTWTGRRRPEQARSPSAAAA